jgi:hypothetical protein
MTYSAVAAELPKPQTRSDWCKAVKWLDRTSEQVINLEHRQSIEVYLLLKAIGELERGAK